MHTPSYALDCHVPLQVPAQEILPRQISCIRAVIDELPCAEIHRSHFRHERTERTVGIPTHAPEDDTSQDASYSIRHPPRSLALH